MEKLDKLALVSYYANRINMRLLVEMNGAIAEMLSTKGKILNTAVKMFSEQGYGKVSMVESGLSMIFSLLEIRSP